MTTAVKAEPLLPEWTCPRCGYRQRGKGFKCAECGAYAEPVAPPTVLGHDVSSKNFKRACMVCGETPTVGDVGLCGPCCFGEAETAGGNW